MFHEGVCDLRLVTRQPAESIISSRLVFSEAHGLCSHPAKITDVQVSRDEKLVVTTGMIGFMVLLCPTQQALGIAYVSNKLQLLPRTLYIFLCTTLQHLVCRHGRSGISYGLEGRAAVHLNVR
jgi:hypothetical protein